MTTLCRCETTSVVYRSNADARLSGKSGIVYFNNVCWIVSLGRSTPGLLRATRAADTAGLARSQINGTAD